MEENNGLSDSESQAIWLAMSGSLEDWERQPSHVPTPQTNVWLAARCKETCYWFLFNHLFDVSESTLNKIASVGNAYLTKYEAKQNRLHEIGTSQGGWYGACPYLTQQYGMLDVTTFHQSVNEVLDFASNTATSFAKEYLIDAKLVYGLAAAFMMPYFYWQIFWSLKIKVGK